MKHDEGLKLGGRGRCIGYPAGLIQSLMDEGRSYWEARQLAEPHAEYGPERLNTICTPGKRVVARMIMSGLGADYAISYIALGTSGSTPAASDTVLGAEAVRKAPTRTERISNEITIETFFTSDQADYYIKEVGVVMGDGATAAKDTGDLFSHYLEDEDNSGGTKDLTFTYTLTVG